MIVPPARTVRFEQHISRVFPFRFNVPVEAVVVPIVVPQDALTSVKKVTTGLVDTVPISRLPKSCVAGVARLIDWVVPAKTYWEISPPSTVPEFAVMFPLIVTK